MNSGLGVFEVTASYDLGLGDASFSEHSVRCEAEDERGQVIGSFDVSIRVREKAWPIIEDLLIEALSESQFRGRQVDSAPNRYYSTRQGDGFAATISGPTRIIAIADVRRGGILGFPSDASSQNVSASLVAVKCPVVLLGGVPCNVESCSPSSVTFITPSFNLLDTINGYASLRIQNPTGLRLNETVGGTIACPGACSLGTLGIYIARICRGFSPPELCSRISDETNDDGSLNCGFGIGADSCTSCSSNGFCPGGLRLWSRRGYWTASETAGSLAICKEPHTERCRGFDPVRGQSACAEGYSGNLCADCTDGYFLELSRCVKCGESDRKTRVGVFVAVIFLISLLMAGCIFLPLFQEKNRDAKSPNPEEGTYGFYLYMFSWEVKDLILWTALMFQLFYLVVTVAGNMSIHAVRIFSWLGILALDFKVMAPECSQAYPDFTREWVIFAVTLILFMASLFSFLPIFKDVHIKGCCRNTARETRGYLQILLLLLYVPATHLVLSSLHCIESNNELGDTVLVSWSYPGQTCRGDVHIPLYSVAILVGVVYTLGFPLMSYWSVSLASYEEKYNAASDAQNNTNAASIAFVDSHEYYFKKFFGDDFKRKSMWFYLLRFALVLVLSVSRVYLSSSIGITQGIRFVINIIIFILYGAVLFYSKPYEDWARWKYYVSIFLLFVLSSSSVLEFINILSLLNDEGDEDINLHVSPESVEGISVFVTVLLILTIISLVPTYFINLHFRRRNKNGGFYTSFFLAKARHAKRRGNPNNTNKNVPKQKERDPSENKTFHSSKSLILRHDSPDKYSSQLRSLSQFQLQNLGSPQVNSLCLGSSQIPQKESSGVNYTSNSMCNASSGGRNDTLRRSRSNDTKRSTITTNEQLVRTSMDRKEISKETHGERKKHRDIPGQRDSKAAENSIIMKDVYDENGSLKFVTI